MRDILIEFLEELREYEHESGNRIAFDDRDSSEIVDVFLRSRLPLNKPLELAKMELDGLRGEHENNIVQLEYAQNDVLTSYNKIRELETSIFMKELLE